MGVLQENTISLQLLRASPEEVFRKLLDWAIGENVSDFMFAEVIVLLTESAELPKLSNNYKRIVSTWG